jgi:hypothetical protein
MSDIGYFYERNTCIEQNLPWATNRVYRAKNLLHVGRACAKSGRSECTTWSNSSRPRWAGDIGDHRVRLAAVSPVPVALLVVVAPHQQHRLLPLAAEVVHSQQWLHRRPRVSTAVAVAHPQRRHGPKHGGPLPALSAAAEGRLL